MNTNSVSKLYDRLTPEERFRLILAASGRGDDVERTRLANAGERLELAVQDHTPYAQAFKDVATQVYLELLDEAARFQEAMNCAAQHRLHDDEVQNAGTAKEWNKRADRQARQAFNLAMAAGFVLRTRLAGWQLFCDRLCVPPFMLWELLPGYERVQRTLTKAENTAFTPEGFVRWLNRFRPAGSAEFVECLLMANNVADAYDALFRHRIGCHGGRT